MRRISVSFTIVLALVVAARTTSLGATIAPQEDGRGQVSSVPEGLRKVPPQPLAGAPQTVRDVPPLELTVRIVDPVGPEVRKPRRAGLQPGRASAVVTVTARELVQPFEIRVVTQGVITSPGAEGFAPIKPEGDSTFGLPANAGYTRTVQGLEAGAVMRFTVPLRLTGWGRGEVLVSTAAVGEAPWAISVSSHDLVLIEGREVVAGALTFTGLEEKRIRSRRIGPATAIAPDLEGQIRKLRRSGALTSPGGPVPASQAPRPALAPQAAPSPGEKPGKVDSKAAVSNGPAATVTVQGRARFSDRAGGNHPVRFAYVELKNPRGGSGEDPNFAQGYTDADGAYSLTFGSPDGVNGPFNTYLVLYAFGDSITVRDLGGDIYAIESEPRSVVPGAENVIDLTSAYDTQHNIAANWSFAAYEAGNFISRYKDMAGEPPGERLTIYFPLPQEGAYYNGAIHIALSDAHDWDVIMHEYGHHLEALAHFANYIPGTHYIGADTCSLANQNKKNAIGLAWGEGWPTFHGTMVQSELGLSALGIPTVGDTTYTDRHPGGNSVIYDLASDTNPGDRGEGDEIAVQRVLWDVYRKLPDVTAEKMWSIVPERHPNSLSDYYAGLMVSRSPARIPLLGEILANHGVGAMIAAPDDRTEITEGSGATLLWGMKPPGTACDPAGKARYLVRFFKEDFSPLPVSVPPQTDTSLSLSPSQIVEIRKAGVGATIHWGVFRTGINPPTTGEYPGSFRTLIVR